MRDFHENLDQILVRDSSCKGRKYLRGFWYPRHGTPFFLHLSLFDGLAMKSPIMRKLVITMLAVCDRIGYASFDTFYRQNISKVFDNRCQGQLTV